MGQILANATGLDYAIVALILLSVIVSFFRGFLREAISLITWFLAFFAALKFSPVVSNTFSNVIHSPTMRYLVSAIVIFIIVLLLGMVINRLARSLVATSGLGLFDHLLGFVFGAARGVLFVTILLLVVNVSLLQNKVWAKQSQLAPYFHPIVAHFTVLIPNDIRIVSTWVEKFAMVARSVKN